MVATLVIDIGNEQVVSRTFKKCIALTNTTTGRSQIFKKYRKPEKLVEAWENHNNINDIYAWHLKS